MDDALRAKLAEFRAEMTRQERKRWRPLYLMIKRTERRLKVDQTELRDKSMRAAAKAQYELIQKLLAVAPRQWRGAP